MAKTLGGFYPSKDFKEFRSYSRDWEKTYFDHETGGFVVTFRERIETGQNIKQERSLTKSIRWQKIWQLLVIELSTCRTKT